MLSRWAAGGPGGSSWNATDLSCFAEVQADCAQGELSAALAIGTQRPLTQTRPVTQRGLQRLDFAVSERDWRRGLDAARKPPLPYRTALFVLRVEGSCRAPEPFGPGDYAYRDVADVRAFVAGFASGE